MAPALPMHGRMIHAIDGIRHLPVVLVLRRPGDQLDRPGRPQRDTARRRRGDERRHAPLRLATVGLRPRDEPARPSSRRGTVVEVDADIVLGADGFGSVVRQSPRAGSDVSASSRTFSTSATRSSRSRPRDGEFALDPDALHIWPRGASMMIALPNPDRSFTCTLFWPKHGSRRIRRARLRRERSSTTSPRPTPTRWPSCRPSSRTTSTTRSGCWPRCTPIPGRPTARSALIGDAAHAILPFFGQGANCGFEDVVELDQCLSEVGDDWSLALPMYQERRRGQCRGDRTAREGELRRDARQGGLAVASCWPGGSSTDSRRPCRAPTCRATRWSRSRPFRTRR